LCIGIGVLETRPREKPVDIRVPKLKSIAAALALTAGLVHSGAQEELRKPMGESLFPDTARTVQKQAGGQRSALEAFAQSFLKVLVSKKGNERHPSNLVSNHERDFDFLYVVSQAVARFLTPLHPLL
jgi:hypothetical protein